MKNVLQAVGIVVVLVVLSTLCAWGIVHAGLDGDRVFRSPHYGHITAIEYVDVDGSLVTLTGDDARKWYEKHRGVRDLREGFWAP